MTWQEFMLAAQLLAEERVGTRVRQVQAEEDAAFAQARENHERIERRRR